MSTMGTSLSHRFDPPGSPLTTAKSPDRGGESGLPPTERAWRAPPAASLTLAEALDILAP